MKLIDDGKHHTTNVRIENFDHAVKVDTVWWHKEITTFDHLFKRSEIASIITLDTGCAHLHFEITPTEARTLAAALLKQADEVEAAIAITTKTEEPA